MTGSGTYLYAVTRPLNGALPSGLCGIGGEDVRVVDADNLACIVSTVGLDEFGEEPLRRNLEDLAWLERVAREHDAVVQAVSDVVTAVPLRLGAVYTDEESAVRRLRDLRAAALATLDVLTGRAEWGVKVYAMARPPAPAGAAPRPASGVDYLRQRRAELDRKAVDAQAMTEDADAVFERLRAVAVLARRHRPQDPVLSGVRDPMVLNAAFLIDRDRVAQFQRTVDALAAERADGAVVLTGPWPPYSFATLDDT